MELKRVEGIILQTHSFQDYDAIVTVFTADLGLIKFIAKSAFRPQRRNMITTPFTRAEFIYSEGKSELLKVREISVIQHANHLRDSFAALDAACDMTNALCHSQRGETPSSDLYALLKAYIDKIPHIHDPYLLAASFRLKILRHDGLLQLTPNCSVCAVPLQVFYMSTGECVCNVHATDINLSFSMEETLIIYLMTHCRTYAELTNVDLNEAFRKKIGHLFNSCF